MNLGRVGDRLYENGPVRTEYGAFRELLRLIHVTIVAPFWFLATPTVYTRRQLPRPTLGLDHKTFHVAAGRLLDETPPHPLPHKVPDRKSIRFAGHRRLEN